MHIIAGAYKKSQNRNDQRVLEQMLIMKVNYSEIFRHNSSGCEIIRKSKPGKNRVFYALFSFALFLKAN
jgi:hypothetical protein